MHFREQPPAGQNVLPFFLFRRLPLVHEAVGVGLVGYAPLHNLAAFFPREGAVHFHRQAEAVQKLGAQVPFFRVHGTHQDEFGGVADGDALPFHVVATHGGGVEQYINQVIVEKVDFIHVQDAPVGSGNQTRLEATGAGLDSLLNV